MKISLSSVNQKGSRTYDDLDNLITALAMFFSILNLKRTKSVILEIH